MENYNSKVIGITMGCPVGIGPEVVVKYLSNHVQSPRFQPVVIGDLEVLKDCASKLGIAALFSKWQPGVPSETGVIQVCHVPDIHCDPIAFAPDELKWGKPNRKTGTAMAAYIQHAFFLVRNGDLAAIATCPITKAILQEAGYGYPGHTEMFAAMCRTSDYAMMLAGNTLRVTLVTIHQSLSLVCQTLNETSIKNLIHLTGTSLQNDFGIKDPKIAVAGLNPHAGEGGMFGREEEQIIAPAIEKAKSQGWLVSGPYPPDTVFHMAVQGEFDVVVCMYHDQGLIPFKLLHFADGVNVTIGLPIVRTSVDHGTAYNIAGRGLANPDSLKAAVEMASEIVANRRRLEKTNNQ